MRYFQKHPIILVLFIAGLVLFYRIDKPFIGHHDWNSVWFANIARNYLRYGLFATKFGQVTNVGQGYTSEQLGYHTHHPPLLPIFIAASFTLFGESEVSTRLIPVLASLVMIYFIYKIGKKLARSEVGLIASLLAVVTPILIYFSKIPVHETVVPAFILFSIYQYLNWLESQKITYFIFLILGLILSQLTGWAGYYIVPILVLHGFFFAGSSERKKVFLLIPLSIGMFVIHLLHVKVLTGSFFGGGLFDVFIFRFMPSRTANLYGFSYYKFIIQEARFIVIYFTKILVLTTLFWLIYFFFKFLRNRNNLQVMNKEIFLFLLLPFGLTHVIVFRNLAFIHDYMIYYLLPFITLSAAVIIDYFFNKIPYRFIASILIVVLVVIVGLERRDFLRALFNTSEGDKGRQLGLFIRKRSEPTDIIFVGSNNYGQFQDVFIGYYGDRRVVYGEKLTHDWQTKYHLIVRPKDHDTLAYQDKLFLDKQYNRKESARFIWYDLAQ